MEVRNVMSTSIRSIGKSDPIGAAARIMGEAGVGVLPVLDGDRLVGIVTDRDLAVRGLGSGVAAGEPVARVMTTLVRSCCSDDDIADVLEIMGDEQIRRMPVCDEAGGIVGMVSIGDLVRKDPDQQEVAEALCEICEPSTRHSQLLAAAAG